jgi:hypothetical protein
MEAASQKKQAIRSSVIDGVYVAIQKRGVVTLPSSVRKRHALDGPGAQVRIVERPDGVIELHPQLAVPADQAWFWSDRWQEMEREAEADIAAGRVTTHDSTEAFLKHVDALGGAA